MRGLSDLLTVLFIFCLGGVHARMPCAGEYLGSYVSAHVTKALHHPRSGLHAVSTEEDI